MATSVSIVRSGRRHRTGIPSRVVPLALYAVCAIDAPARAAAPGPNYAAWIAIAATALLPCAWLVLRVIVRNARFGVPTYQMPRPLDPDQRWIVVEAIVLAFLFRLALRVLLHHAYFLRR